MTPSKRSIPTRRDVMLTAAGAVTAAALGASAKGQNVQTDGPAPALKGHINHSACLWCYRPMTPEQFAPVAKRIGLKGIDLLTPEQFGPLKEHGLICTMTSQASNIQTGLNRKENHGPIIEKLKELINANAEFGFPNVICFSGNRHAGRNGPVVSDEEGMKTCAEGLKEVVGLAEQKKVTIIMELLNSKRTHPDYMCDRTAWGVQLCKMVGSERFKLLYDIYHMQLMEGDIIATLKENIQYIGHIHTGGVPGRHEIDDTQELNYPAIMQALVDLKYTGYVAQEFTPAKPDKIASLAAAVKICDV